MPIKLADKKEKKEFFKTLNERSRTSRNPFSIMFELTYKCNFKCFHCYLPGSRKEKKELSKKQVCSILDQLKDMGIFRIGFTGGEALARKDIFEILEYASKCGFEVNLLSNGYLIDKKTAVRLKKANVYKVDITFNAMDPEIFDKITKVKGSFVKVKKAVELLLENGIEVILKATCMKINKDEIPKVSKFARDMGVVFWMDGEILPCRNNDATLVDQFSVSSNEIEKLRRLVYPEMFSENRPQAKHTKNREKLFNCGVGVNSFSIDPHGRMNFCIEIGYPRYNMLTLGVKACWNKLKKEIDKLNNTKDFICKNCDLFDFCGWCAGRSFIEGRGFNSCSEHLKRIAKERKEAKDYGHKQGIKKEFPNS